MTYDPAQNWSRAIHRKYHDAFLNGVPLKKTTSDERIAAWGDLELLLVTPTSKWVQMKRAEKVAQHTRHETLYDTAAYYAGERGERGSPLVFYGVQGERGVSLLVLGFECRGALVSWKDYDARQSINPDLHERWYVSMAWTLPSLRRRGIARWMIEIAAAQVKLPVSGLGWLLPFSDAGCALARSLCPGSFIAMW